MATPLDNPTLPLPKRGILVDVLIQILNMRGEDFAALGCFIIPALFIDTGYCLFKKGE